MTGHSPSAESDRSGAGIAPLPTQGAGTAPLPLTGRQAACPAIDGLGLFAVILWLGLITGFVEGIGILALQRLNWLPWRCASLGHSVKAVWISTIVDLCLFGGLGAAAAVATKLPGRRFLYKASVGTAATLMFLDWLAIPLFGRIALYGLFILAAGLAVTAVYEGRKHQAAILGFCRRFVLAPPAAAVLLAAVIQGGLWLWEPAATARLPAALPGMPNVLLLVVDTVRADHLSCYGYHRPTSPNLDALAREGVLFENAIAPSSWTQPSHASLLTGQYTHEHHAEFDPLDKRYPTIGEALSRQGYRAGAFSGNLNYFTQAQGFGRGFLHFEDYYFNVLDMVLRTAPGRVIDVYVFDRFPKVRRFWRKRAPEVNAEFFRWVDADRERPFFAFLNYFDVHSPYLLPGALRGRFGTGSHSELDAGRLVGDERDADHLLKDEPGTPERSIDAYDDCTLYADEHLRRLLWGLRERGLADNTLVIVTSDHGEQFMAHGLQGHGNSLYRQLIHVPLVVCWPGHVPAGVRVAQPVSIKALAATVLDLIGVQDETAFDDPSLARLWQDPAAAEHWPHPVAELAINPLFSKKNPVAHGAMKCLVTPDWHLIVNQELPPELYDWKRDPQELHNRAGQKAMAPEIERLEAELEKLVPGWL